MLKEIKLTEAESKHIETFIYQQRVADAAFYAAAEGIKSSKEALWKHLRKLYPDISFDGATFDNKDKIIRYHVGQFGGSNPLAPTK